MVPGFLTVEGSGPPIVTFGGVGEGFGWDRRLARIGARGLCLLDSRYRWYLDGCDGLSEAHTLELMRDFIGFETALFVGQSAGGYAALRYADQFDAHALAFAPQTFHIKGFKTYPPSDLVDIRWDLISRTRATRIDVYVSRSEWANPATDYFWGDHAHVTGLERGQNIHLHEVEYDAHPCALHLARTGHLDAILDQALRHCGASTRKPTASLRR
jgi:pimeloyl-ACP methyl ester carboxylesterase